jgi:hypothetical protein
MIDYEFAFDRSSHCIAIIAVALFDGLVVRIALSAATV